MYSCKKDNGDNIPEITFNPSISYGNMTDQDGHTYKTVAIGTQVWMAENLKTTKYRNGDPITNVTDNIQWKNLISGAYCNYDNNIQNTNIYGCLYNWFAVNDSRKIAPTGWHVPSDSEWKTLIDYLGGPYVSCDKLKETGTTHWNSSNSGATNESGFTALPSGYRGKIIFGGADLGYNFIYKGLFGIWWTSTDTLSIYAFERDLNTISVEVDWGYSTKDNGYSIRCVKD